MVGTTFGQYLLREKIAQGGMAEVFAAERVGARDFRREVCIKRILPKLGHDRGFVEMFIDEARICSRLRHSNIVAIDDFGEIDGQLYACMEWVNGVDAARVLKALVAAGRPFPVDAAFFLCGEVLRALEYAHGKRDGGRDLQIVHRDVSPHNVLVSYVGEVKLTDFGIARAASRLHVTQEDVVKGKLAYMAPEQALGKPIDGRVDVFAVGVMLYELLAGRRPHLGAQHDVVLAAIEGRRTPIRALRPELTPAMATVIDGLLEPDADRRFLSAADALDAIAGLGLTTGQRSLAALMAELYPDSASVVTPRRSAPTPIGGTAPRATAIAEDATISLSPSVIGGPTGTEVSPPPRIPVAPAPVAPAAPAPAPTGRPWLLLLGLVALLSVLSTVALAAYVFLLQPAPAPAAAAPVAVAPVAPVAVAPPAPRPVIAPPAPAPQTPSPQAPAPQAPAPAPAPATAPPEAARPAWLSVVPVPWGNVSVDGRSVSPRQWVSLAPGPHRVVVRQEGGRSASRSVNLAPGQRLSLTVPVN